MSNQRDPPMTAASSFGISDPINETSDKVTSFLPRAFTSKNTFIEGKKETPLDVLNNFIKEIQEADANHEEIANKYLELYDRESKFIIKSKDVKKFLPNFNIKSEKKLLQLFGVTPTGAMNPKDPKDTFYFFTPHQYILTTMVHAVSYASFEDRIDFAFMMYDSDNDGKISKADLKEMFSLYGRENAFRIDNDNLESIIQVIFNSIAPGPDGLISLADFRVFFQGERTKSIKINVFERRKAKTHFSKIESKPSTKKPNNNGILPKIGKWCDSLFNLIQKSKAKLVWMIIWGIGMLYFFISTFLMYYDKLGVAAGIAKGSAMVVDYNMAFMIVLATKSLTTIIRTLGLAKILPVNNNVYLHTRIGFVTFAAAWIHSLAHLIFVLPMLAGMTLPELQANLLTPPSTTHNYLYWVFRSLPGWTGILALIMMTILPIMAIKKLRNQNYERFWYTHFLWLPMFVLLSIHGIARYLGNPKFYFYGGIPACVLLIEKLWVLIDFFRKPFKILDMTYLDSEVIELKVIRPCGYKYIPGQYCLVKIPRLSNYQWHPFSLSSSPDDEFISFHISPVGDWTNEVKKLALDYKAKKLNKVPSIFVLGPYGAPSQHYGDYQHLMIVSSGIGATPFASIMRHLNSQVKKDPEANARTKSVDFYWVNKKPSSHIWLASLFKELQANEAVQGLIKINMFFTSPHEKYDLRSILLWKGLEMLNAQGTKVKGLEHFDLMRWGRPEWSEIFEKKVEEIKSGTVGVFFCGNQMLAKELHDNCVRYSGNGVVFKFCKEIF